MPEGAVSPANSLGDAVFRRVSILFQNCITPCPGLKRESGAQHRASVLLGQLSIRREEKIAHYLCGRQILAARRMNETKK